MQKNIPAVSVVIPMYNAEKYIGECIESIMAQTFQDFEIIVVDDCSTDNSCAVAEKFVGDKLKLIRRNVNSGMPGIPSNIGLEMSRGEYILFVDNDDGITETALEELYPIAKKFEADVVACEKYFQFYDDEKFHKKNLTSYHIREFVTKPTVISDKVEDRISDLQNLKFLWNLWSQLVRRDFLIENNIKFMNAMGQDFLCTACIVCTVKKFVRVPNVINYYRVRRESTYHSSINPNDTRPVIKKWFNALNVGISHMDKFLDTQENFQGRTDLKYLVFDIVAREFLKYLLPIYSKTPAFQLDEILRAEFEQIKNPALSAFLFSRMNIFNINLLQQLSRR